MLYVDFYCYILFGFDDGVVMMEEMFCYVCWL